MYIINHIARIFNLVPEDRQGRKTEKVKMKAGNGPGVFPRREARNCPGRVSPGVADPGHAAAGTGQGDAGSAKRSFNIPGMG